MTDLNDAPQKPKRKWLLIVVGVLFLMCVLGIGAVVFTAAWFRQHMEITETSDADASVAFDAVTAKFAGQQPLLEFHDDRARPTIAAASATPSTTALTTLHILAFDDDEGHLARIDVPFWILRLKSGPIAFGAYASGFDDDKVKLRVEDIERRGPGIVLDLMRPGEGRVLIWAE